MLQWPRTTAAKATVRSRSAYLSRPVIPSPPSRIDAPLQGSAFAAARPRPRASRPPPQRRFRPARAVPARTAAARTAAASCWRPPPRCRGAPQPGSRWRPVPRGHRIACRDALRKPRQQRAALGASGVSAPPPAAAGRTGDRAARTQTRIPIAFRRAVTSNPVARVRADRCCRDGAVGFSRQVRRCRGGHGPQQHRRDNEQDGGHAVKEGSPEHCSHGAGR